MYILIEGTGPLDVGWRGGGFSRPLSVKDYIHYVLFSVLQVLHFGSPIFFARIGSNYVHINKRRKSICLGKPKKFLLLMARPLRGGGGKWVGH